MLRITHLRAKLVSIAILLLGCLVGLPVFAVTGVNIRFTGDLYYEPWIGPPTECADARFLFDFQIAGTVDDLNGLDYYAILLFDGNNRLLSVHNLSIGFNQTADFFSFISLSAIQPISARPITVRVYDVPYSIYSDTHEQTLAAGQFVLDNGTPLDSDSIDPAGILTDCEKLSSGANAGFDPGDDRINPDAHAPVAIYCRDNGAVEVLNIDAGGNGSQAFLLTGADISAAASGGMVTQVGNVSLFKLADGRLQINAVLLDGKGYAFLWDTCPVTYSETYTIENGQSSLLIARSY